MISVHAQAGAEADDGKATRGDPLEPLKARTIRFRRNSRIGQAAMLTKSLASRADFHIHENRGLILRNSIDHGFSTSQLLKKTKKTKSFKYCTVLFEFAFENSISAKATLFARMFLYRAPIVFKYEVPV